MPILEAQTVAMIMVEEMSLDLLCLLLYTLARAKCFAHRNVGVSAHIQNANHPNHIQSDGMVEWFNHSLTISVRSYQRDWDDQLQYVMMAYSSSMHESKIVKVPMSRDVRSALSVKNTTSLE